MDPDAPPERELTPTERRMLVHKPDAKEVYMDGGHGSSIAGWLCMRIARRIGRGGSR